MAVQTGKKADAEEDDPWQTGSGMVDDIDAYIQEPFFGVDEKYNAEAMLFCATLVDPDGEPLTTLKYSVGQGWEAEDDGSEVRHPSKARITNSSRFGLFIDRIAGPTDERSPKNKEIESPKGAENGLGLGKQLRERGTPFQAKTFDGLGFHWKLHRMPTMGKDPKTQERIYKDVLLPVAFIGEYSERNGAAPAKRGATPVRGTGKAAPKPAAAEEEAAEIDLPVALRKKLTGLAQSATAKEFTKAAAKDKDVLALPDDTMSHIINPGPSGFWQSVQE